MTEAELIEGTVARLMEHFEAVQIFATSVQDGNTVSLECGSGNYYARLGIAQEWVTKNDERVRCQIRRTVKRERQDDQEGEE